jgi:hypothetical protein
VGRGSGIYPKGERRIFRVLNDLYPAAMTREAIDDAIGYERSSLHTRPHVRTPNESPVKWTYRRKGSSLVEVTVELTYWIDPGGEPSRQCAAAAITGEDYYDGDTGTISIV